MARRIFNKKYPQFEGTEEELKEKLAELEEKYRVRLS